MTELLQPIDAVVTWVDGADPAHQAKLKAYLESIGHVPEAAHPTRFRETGEFEYCIASMLRFAPWLRKIYILTDNQTPSFMSMVSQSPNSERIVVVDHKTVFEGYEQHLPTFNSRSLGTILWRIPGLADQFLILGDDQILLQDVWPEDFFRGDKMVVRGGWYPQYEYRRDLRLKRFFNIGGTKNDGNTIPRPGMRMGQASAGIIAGFKKKYFRMPHNHHPQIKSLLEEFYRENPQVFEKNISFRLRSSEQFLPEALVTHIAFKKSRVIVENRLLTLLLKMEKISVPWLKLRLALAKVSGRFAFGCIQSLDMAPPETREIVMNWVNKRIGSLAENLNREYIP